MKLSFLLNVPAFIFPFLLLTMEPKDADSAHAKEFLASKVEGEILLESWAESILNPLPISKTALEIMGELLVWESRGKTAPLTSEQATHLYDLKKFNTLLQELKAFRGLSPLNEMFQDPLIPLLQKKAVLTALKRVIALHTEMESTFGIGMSYEEKKKMEEIIELAHREIRS
jgi:hypothetical protein